MDLTKYAARQYILNSDPYWMSIALRLAEKAAHKKEVPVGALIVKNNQVISWAYNLREKWQSPLGHAELIAIQRASRALGAWRLLDCTLYVTLEPCLMCAGAILQSRIPYVKYAAKDPKAGAIHSLYTVLTDERLNHRCEITGDILAEESSLLLKSFFKKRRSEKI